jgi:hypothetical protein
MIDSIVQVQETLQGMSEGLARDRQHVHHQLTATKSKAEQRLAARLAQRAALGIHPPAPPRPAVAAGGRSPPAEGTYFTCRPAWPHACALPFVASLRHGHGRAGHGLRTR